MVPQSAIVSNVQPKGEVLIRLNAIEQRLAKDEHTAFGRPQSNGEANGNPELAELRNRVKLLEINMAGLKESILKHQESVIPTMEKEMIHLTHVMEERESIIKNEMAQFTEQVADASAEREKRIKDDMAQITDEVANAAASMIEKILQDLGALTHRVQQVEFVQDVNGRSVLQQSEAEWGDRSRASWDIAKSPGMSQSSGQGSRSALQESRTGGVSIQPGTQTAHFDNLSSLNQSLFNLSHAVDRMVHNGGRGRDTSVDAHEGYSQPSSATPTMSWKPRDDQIDIAGRSGRVHSPRGTMHGRKPESSPPPRGQPASVPPMHRSSSPLQARHKVTTPRAASRDDAARRVDPQRGSLNLPMMAGSHRFPITGSHSLQVNVPVQVNGAVKSGMTQPHSSQAQRTVTYSPKSSEIAQRGALSVPQPQPQSGTISMPVYHPKANFTTV